MKGCRMFALTVFLVFLAVPEVDEPIFLPCYVHHSQLSHVISRTHQKRRYLFALSLMHPFSSLDKLKAF